MIEIKLPSKNDIDTVIYDPWCWDRTTDDNCPSPEDFKIPYDDFAWVGGYVNGQIASLYMVSYTGKMHFQVLPAYRMQAHNLFESSFTHYGRPVYCVIPVLYQSVINFVKKHKFKETLRFIKDHVKNGQRYDAVMMFRGL